MAEEISRFEGRDGRERRSYGEGVKRGEEGIRDLRAALHQAGKVQGMRNK